MPPRKANFTELIVSPSAAATRERFLDMLARAKIGCITRLETTGDCLVHFESSKEPDVKRAVEKLRQNIHALAPAAFDQADQRLVGDVFANESFEIEDDKDEGEWIWPATPVVPPVSNDPYFSEQEQLVALNAVLAWEGVNERQPVIVAVLDEGISLDQPDLKGNLEPGISLGCDPQQYQCDGSPALPTDQHGTKVAGVISAVRNNGIGIVGAAWHARIIPINIGVRGGSDITAACGVEIAVRRGAYVINASWWHRKRLKELYKVLLAADPRVVFVSGAGSGGNVISAAYPSYPLLDNLTNVVGVAAHRDTDQPLKGSNRSKQYVHITAQAYAYTTLICQKCMNCYGQEYGNTSYATAYVSAMVALLKSRYPDWSSEWIKWRIVEDAIDSNKLKPMSASGGRLDLGRTMFPVTTTPTSVSRGGPTLVDWKTGIRGDMCPQVSIHVRVGEAGNMGTYSVAIPLTDNDGDESVSADRLPSGQAKQIQFLVSCTNSKADAASPPIDLIN